MSDIRAVGNEMQGRDPGVVPNEPTTGPVSSSPGRRAPRLELVRGSLALLRLGPSLILVILVLVLSAASPVFATTANLGNVLSQTAVIAVLAIGQLLVILTRGIDLSVGSTLALASVVGALAFADLGSGLVTILAMLGAGLAVGAVNGLVYVFGRL